MSDFELFSGGDQGEAMSEEDFEKFREQMKAAAAQMKASQKGEQKQKKKEVRLADILSKFIQDSGKRDLMLLAARLLEQNIPPVFVLGILLLGNKDMQSEAQVSLSLPPMEGQPQDDDQHEENMPVIRENLASLIKSHPGQGNLSLKAKIEIDNWIKYMHEQALTTPAKLIQNALNDDGDIKLIVLQLTAFVLRDFMEQEKSDAEFDHVSDFATLIMEKIMADAASSLKKTQIEEKKEE